MRMQDYTALTVADCTAIWISILVVFLPLRLSSRAVSLPIPVLAPVITATLPSNRTRLVQRGPWNHRGITTNEQMRLNQLDHQEAFLFVGRIQLRQIVTRYALSRLLRLLIVRYWSKLAYPLLTFPVWALEKIKK